MSQSTIDSLASGVSNPHGEEIERLASAFRLGRTSRPDAEGALAALVALAADSSLPDDVLDEVGRSLARVVDVLRALDLFIEGDIYRLTPVAFASFDQEIAIRQYLRADESPGQTPAN